MSTTTKSLQTIFTENPNLSLRRFCIELDLCYQYILKLSKQPIVGQAYDPSAINYASIEKLLAVKKVSFSDVDWKAINDASDFTPINKDLAEFKVGDQFTLRKEETLYEIVYKNNNYVTFIDASDSANSQIRSMNNDTFLHQSPRKR